MHVYVLYTLDRFVSWIGTQLHAGKGVHAVKELAGYNARRKQVILVLR